MSQAEQQLSLETRIARNDDILFSDVADGMSLMDIESGKYFHFEQTGTRIWKQIEGTVSVGEICEKLQSEFDVSPDTCRSDTLEFVRELSGMELITLVD